MSLKKNVFIFLGIFIILLTSRFLPHPPNFTPLISLAFYVPAVLGIKFIPHLIFSFILTDLMIGYHNLTHWTWGSILIIGLMSIYFTNNLKFRIFGALSGSIIFFLITNFGVWLSGMYGLTLDGLYICYIMAIPFFYYSLISTIIFSIIIELILKIIKSEAISFKKDVN